MIFPYFSGMRNTIEKTATITAKGQTTVPKAVRQALGVDYGGTISFRVGRDGVTVRRAETTAEDPVIDAFLGFLAADMAKRPARLKTIPDALAKRVRALARGAKPDLDAAIEGPVDL